MKNNKVNNFISNIISGIGIDDVKVKYIDGFISFDYKGYTHLLNLGIKSYHLYDASKIAAYIKQIIDFTISMKSKYLSCPYEDFIQDVTINNYNSDYDDYDYDDYDDFFDDVDADDFFDYIDDVDDVDADDFFDYIDDVDDVDDIVIADVFGQRSYFSISNVLITDVSVDEISINVDNHFLEAYNKTVSEFVADLEARRR